MEHRASACPSLSVSPRVSPSVSPRPYSRCAPSPADDRLLGIVAASFALPPADLMSPSRCSARAAFARQVAMYLAHVSFGANFSAIGRAFGRDRTTAAHAVRVIEERRDDPCIDALLERLESACAGFAGPARNGKDGAR